MLNKLKNKWFWLSLIVIIIAIFVIISLSADKESNYVTETVVKDDLIQTVEVTGSIEAAEDIDLNFNQVGNLQAVLVKAGDEVKVGQVMARLMSGDIASQVADARASLEIAKLELEELLLGASSEDIQVTEKELNQTQTNYQTALDTLENLKNTRNQELVNYKETLVNTLKDKHSIAQYALDVIDDALLDTDADNYLYVSDIILLNNTSFSYQPIYTVFSNLDDLIKNINENTSNEEILAIADSLELNLEDILLLLTQTYDIMGATVENSVYTSAIISSLKTNITTQSTNINAAISAVQTASADLRTKILYYQTEIVNIQNSAESALDSLNLAQAKLDLKQAPPRDFEISTYQAKIDRAQATLNRYLSNWGETIIKAPVDGIVTKINFDIGEQTSLTTPVISIIGLSNMQIEVDVPESDIVKLEVNDQVDIDIDAFSSEEKFIGTVTFIDPAATNIDGVVYYQIKVSLNEKDERIKSGMTADLTISTDNKEDVLLVPSRAVISREGSKYVQLLENKTLVEKKVTVGLKGDGGLIEVITGVNEGDQVITFIKNSK